MAAVEQTPSWCGISLIPMEKPLMLWGTSLGGAFHRQRILPLAASRQAKTPSWPSSPPMNTFPPATEGVE
jgi:hypothetical protein